MVQSADGIAITMEYTLEALSVITDRCPVGVVGVSLRFYIALEEELQISAAPDVFVHGVVAIQGTTGTGDDCWITIFIHFVLQGEVEEVLQEVELALVVVGTFAVVDVDLAGT